MAEVITLEPRTGRRHTSSGFFRLDGSAGSPLEQYSMIHTGRGMRADRVAQLPPAARNFGIGPRRPDGGGDAA